MTRYLLDTNTASYVIRDNPPKARERLAKTPLHLVCISAITEAELRFGAASKPEATALSRRIGEFLDGIEIIPWDSPAAADYAELRARCQKDGTPLKALDMLIAAHAISLGATLVTSDQAFYQLRPGKLRLINWTK